MFTKLSAVALTLVAVAGHATPRVTASGTRAGSSRCQDRASCTGVEVHRLPRSIGVLPKFGARVVESCASSARHCYDTACL